MRRDRRAHDLVRRAQVLSSERLGHRVVSGASFTFLGIALRTALTLGSVSILARLLTPADFGYIAMATVVTEFAALLSGFGFANILIQRRVTYRVQFDTVYWASVAVGVVVAALVFGLSFVSGWLFADPLTGALLRVLCLTFVLGGFTTAQEAILARLMRFRTEFFIQTFAVLARAATAIAFAYAGFGVWSLVAGALAGAVASLLALIVLVPYRPRLRFDARYLTSTWTTSGSYLGRGLLYYLDMNVDLALIGRYLGATPLGLYQNGRALTDEVRGRIAIPLQRVLFPAFASLQADHVRLQELVMRSGRILAAIVIPVGIGASAVAPELVPTLYGAQWAAMVPIVAMLGVSTALKASTAIASPIYNATNHVGLALRYNVVGTALTAATVVGMLPFGIDAVALGIAGMSMYSLITFRVGLGLIGMTWRDALRILGAPTLAATAMWLAIAGLRVLTAPLVPAVPARLATYVGAGALTYAVMLHLLSRQYLQDFKDLARRLVRRG